MPFGILRHSDTEEVTASSDLIFSVIEYVHRPGVELLRRLCPHLDALNAIEGHQRQVGLPGEDLFYCFCPHMDEASTIEGRQRQVRLPGVELLRRLCPHLDGACIGKATSQPTSVISQTRVNQNPGKLL